MSYLLDDLIEFEKTAGIFDKLRKKKFPNQIRKLSNPTVYEKIQALPSDLRIKYSKDSMKFNQDRWDYVHKNVKDSDFDQEGNLNDDKYFPLVDSFNKKYGKLTPMGYVYKKQANEGIAGQEKTATFAPAPIKPPTGIGGPMKAPKMPGIVKGGPNRPSSLEGRMSAIALHKSGIRGGRWTTHKNVDGGVDIRPEKTASLTPTFYQAVKEDNVQRVRIMMKDSLLVDPTFKEYNQMKDAAKNMKGLYDKHDGRSYSLDKNTWNDNYMDTEMVRAVGNFSPERTQHLQDVVSHLRPEAHNAAPKVEPNPAPWSHKKMALGVGAGLAAVGGGAYLYNRYKKKKRAQAEQEKTASDGKTGGLMTAGGLGLTAATLYGSLALQKRLKEKYGDIDGVNETSFLSGIGNDKASNRIYPTHDQAERANKFRKSFNRINFGSRVGFGVGSGLALGGASMLADAVSRR